MADDPDQDGLSNADEFIVGTDPKATTSNLKLALSTVSDGMEVSCPTLAASEEWYDGKSRYYTLESAPAPSGPWIGVSGAINVPGTGAALTRTLAAGNSAQFVRVRVRLQ